MEMYLRPYAAAFHLVTRSDERVAVLIETLGVLAGTADSRDFEAALA
jgi:hypothetical protein